jgi:preprotein translocase subunit SecF
MFVTAVLTTMSFSVHDTIIIFDKIREYHKEQKTLEIESASNQALTETMVRSLNNSMTIVFMLLALTMMGGATIRFFILTLLIGTITGTYSSPFVATPILVWLEKKQK